jgi:hypothetical protein
MNQIQSFYEKQNKMNNSSCTITGSTLSAGVLSTSSSPSSINCNNLSTINVSDVNINGISLRETLQKIEQRLNILAPNKELEAQWEELQELGEKYRKLEKELESYNKVWEILSTDK